jgi:hypothetical protein
MKIESDIQKDLVLLNENIMKSARLAALGTTEAERVEASNLYDQLTAQRTKLQAAVKVPSYDPNSIGQGGDQVTPSPYERIAFLEQKMAEAANAGEMALYSTMRNEKKQLIKEHGSRPVTMVSNTSVEIKARKEELRAADLKSRQHQEDLRNKPPERLTFAEEGDIERQMTEAASAGDYKEYGRLRKKRQAAG